MATDSHLNILWVEGDDESHDPFDPRKPVRALCAYLLLADSVVLHPAYVWQSQATNKLIVGEAGQQLGPDVAKVFLGYDTPSVAAYMDVRVAKSSTLRGQIASIRTESDEYSTYDQDTRLQQQDLLDARYTAHGAVLKSGREKQL